MSNFQIALYIIIFIWVPIISGITAILSLIIALYFKGKSKDYKRYLIVGVISIIIFLLITSIFVIAGLSGFGPGIVNAD